MFTEQITVTIATVAHVLSEAWDKNYRDAIAAGTTGIRKLSVSDGEILHRVAHDAIKNGNRRHVEQLVRTYEAAGVDDDKVIAHLVIEHSDSAVSRQRAKEVTLGLVGMLSDSNIDDLLADSR